MPEDKDTPTPSSGFDRDRIVRAVEDQVTCDLADEAVILQLNDGIYYGLNPVGATVWKLIQKPRTVRELRDAILEEYEVEADRCERDLAVLLTDLEAQNLIWVCPGEESSNS